MASIGGGSGISGGTQGAGTAAFASTLTDLMTSLAVIFILLLVVFLKQAHDQSHKAKEDVRKQLSEVLENKKLEIKQDPEDPLKLAVKLDETQLRFPISGASLSSGGAEFVQSFFRIFGKEICDPKLREKVDSIIIEGHTDRSGERTPEGVRSNIALSQKRSFSVLESALKGVQSDPATYECLLKLTSASGRGSRSPVLIGEEYSPDDSRRVEVKIRVRSAEQQFRGMAESQSAPPPAQSTPPKGDTPSAPEIPAQAIPRT